MATRPLELRYAEGNALRMAGDIAGAESLLRGVLAEQPAHRDAAYSLAYMLREGGRTQAAAAIVAHWLAHADADNDAALGAIGFLVECAAFDRALDIARKARARFPGDARLAARLGDVALALGLFDEALAALRDAVDANPRLAQAWLRLAHCKRFVDPNDADLARLRRACDDRTLDTPARVCAAFALGKALDDLGDVAGAVAVLRPANATARAASAWRSADWQRFVAARLRTRALPRVAAQADFTPVFVIGMPRTGTTLVANRLGRRSGVRDRGELNWLPAFFAHLTEQARLDDPAALAAVATAIRAQMRRDDAPAQWYIDKNPLNFRFVDLALALFPNARFVHCTRTPRDTALSIWMQHFAHEDLGFAYAFADIAEVARAEATLVHHWLDRGIAITPVDYATLVADADAGIDRLAATLGLPATTAAAVPEAITTASVWQARQPVTARAVGRWEAYAPLLPELGSLFDA